VSFSARLKPCPSRIEFSHTLFSPFAKNPLTDLGRAANRYNALIFTVTQESYGLNVHKSDFAQVDDYANAVIVEPAHRRYGRIEFDH
jgi:hypothetical protein